MKTSMTTFVITALLTLQLGFSNESNKRIVSMTEKIEYGKKNCVVSMQSENTGVVEASILFAAKMKLRFPTTPMNDIETLLAEMSAHHPSAAVRYKAYIASSICADPEWYMMDSNVMTANNEEFFLAATSRLQQKLFGVNIP